MKYMIQGYQVVYANGGRDTVKLTNPQLCDDLERFRREKKKAHEGCVGVNLTYVELN